MDISQLNNEAQAHAAELQAAVTQMLWPAGYDTSSRRDSACAELQAVFIRNEALQRQINNKHRSAGADEVDDMQAACRERAVVLNNLLQQLDDSICSLRSQLDESEQLLRVLPCTTAPNTIIKYSHTLRHVFQPLGITLHQLGAPPAPQEFHFIPSSLKKYHEAKQREQGAAAQPSPSEREAEQQLRMGQQQPQQHRQELAIPQQATAPLAMIGALNTDLEPASDETTDEEFSASDSDYSS